MSIIKKRWSNELDVRDYRWKDVEDLKHIVMKECRRFAMFAPTSIPSAIIMTDIQRKLLPAEWNFINTPWNVMEIIVDNQ